MKQKIVITHVGLILVKNDIKNFQKNNFEYKFICGIVNDQLLNKAQLNGARAAIVGSEYFDEESLPIRKHQPVLGEHSRQILSEIGYSEEEIRELIE